LPHCSIPLRSLPASFDVPQCYSPQISNLTTLTGGGRVDTAIAGRIQPPKLKQQRMTASALQRKRIERKPSNHAGLCDRCCRRHCRHRHQNRPPPLSRNASNHKVGCCVRKEVVMVVVVIFVFLIAYVASSLLSPSSKSLPFTLSSKNASIHKAGCCIKN
jgi:hypothetical protein